MTICSSPCVQRNFSRVRKDGREGSHAAGRFEDRSRAGGGRDGGHGRGKGGEELEGNEEGREMGTGRERACKKGRGGGGRK